MKISGIQSFRGDSWLHPESGTIYFVYQEHHTDFVIDNLGYFGLEAYEGKLSITNDDALYLALTRGWVRCKLNNNPATIQSFGYELNLQAASIMLIHKALKIITRVQKVDILIYDVVKSAAAISLLIYGKNQPLRGERLEYFLKKGRLPSDMIKEGWEGYKAWYDSKTDKLYKFREEHASFMLHNRDLFNLTNHVSHNEIKIAIEEMGWVRIILTLNVLNIQSTNLSSAYKAAKIITSESEVHELNLDIEKEKDHFWIWSAVKRNVIRLKGDRLEYFLKRGRLPSDMIKEAVFTFGRFNPPTKGHQKLINRVIEMAEQQSADHFVFPTKTVDRKNNPLTFEDKVFFLKKIIEANITELETPTIFGALHWLEEQGYTKATLVVGQDRLNEFNEMINPYRKDFTTQFKIESAGNRDESNTIEGISGTKAREFVRNRDFDSFASMVPLDEIDAKSLYDNVYDGLRDLTEAEKMRILINAEIKQLEEKQ